jgi:hypothetical protein
MTNRTVKWINESKGFGLITPDGGGKSSSSSSHVSGALRMFLGAPRAATAANQ